MGRRTNIVVIVLVVMDLLRPRLVHLKHRVVERNCLRLIVWCSLCCENGMVSLMEGCVSFL